MAPLACLLQELGHEVRGSDGPLYPPMSTLLEAAGIVPEVGFDAGHLDPAAGASTPDLVIVGNAVAFDGANGELLWHTRIGNITNGPQTYEVNGRQHLLLAVNDMLYAFTLY